MSVPFSPTSATPTTSALHLDRVVPNIGDLPNDRSGMCFLYPFEKTYHGARAGARSIRSSTRSFSFHRSSGDDPCPSSNEIRSSGETTARSNSYVPEKPTPVIRAQPVAHDKPTPSKPPLRRNHAYAANPFFDPVNEHHYGVPLGAYDYDDRYDSDPALLNTGKFSERDMPDYSGRDWTERAFTVGIGGPVGSGKTALLLALCRALREKHNIAAVTNDIFTREDQEFLIRNEALPKERIRAIETGGCPHAAIREDISANLHALEELQAEFDTELLFVESGGDNLAANYSRELADYIIYVIDVAGGDKVPRKGGPGITQSDLFIINKIDLAPHVGASLEVMRRDSATMRESGSTLFTSVRNGEGVDAVVDAIISAWKVSGAYGKGKAQPSV